MVIPSPRDIMEFTESTGFLRIDKLWIKYHKQQDAYDLAREWFLNRMETYTHMIILPDDLIIDAIILDRILKRSKVDYDNNIERVWSGWCPNTIPKDETKWYIDSNVSIHAPPENAANSKYEDFHFIKSDTLRKLLREGQYEYQVGYSGFALISIPRSVVEKIEFRSDNDCCVDNYFSLDCIKLEIPQFVDLTCESRHLWVRDL